MKRIVLATFGSLGDVHPYIAIALDLQRRGHQAVIVTSDVHRTGIEAAGVRYAPMRPHSEHLGDPAELVRRLFHPTQGPQYLIRDVVMPHLRGAYADLERACTGADLLVSHPLTFGARLVAEKHGLAWRSSVLSPMSVMSYLDPPLFGPAPWLRWIRRLGVAPYRRVFHAIRRRVGEWEAPLHALRAELGLPPRPHAQFEGQYAPGGTLALFSRVLAVPQPDWPPHTTLCGFSRYDGAAPDSTAQRALDDFLGGGAPPIVFTLGSSVSMYASDFFRIAIECTRRLGQRALLITGQDPGEYDAAIAAARLPHGAILVMRYLPYSAAFAHAAVNVHQGGIGTLAQALAAGRPQLITPVAFDQPDNAQRAVRLGVARSIAFQKLSATRMTAALHALLAGPAYRDAAAAIARVVIEEEEAQRAGALLAAG